MASTARKIRLDTANAERMRSVTLPIFSAGMRPPRPHPRPARATEKSAHSSETNRNGNELGHDPPGERIGSQGFQPASFPQSGGIGEHQKPGDKRCGNKNRPGMKQGEETQKN